MPGRGRRAAEDVIAETGADMSRSAAGAHLASRAGRTPLDRQSGARQGKARRKHGNRYIGAVTGEIAVAAGKTDITKSPSAASPSPGEPAPVA
jgi:transposase